MLGPEAIIAIVTLFVTCTPAALLLRRWYKQRTRATRAHGKTNISLVLFSFAGLFVYRNHKIPPSKRDPVNKHKKNPVPEDVPLTLPSLRSSSLTVTRFTHPTLYNRTWKLASFSSLSTRDGTWYLKRNQHDQVDDFKSSSQQLAPSLRCTTNLAC